MSVKQKILNNYKNFKKHINRKQDEALNQEQKSASLNDKLIAQALNYFCFALGFKLFGLPMCRELHQFAKLEGYYESKAIRCQDHSNRLFGDIESPYFPTDQFEKYLKPEMQKQIETFLKLNGFNSIEEAEDQNFHSLVTLSDIQNAEYSNDKLICMSIAYLLVSNDSSGASYEFLEDSERQRLIRLRDYYSLKARGDQDVKRYFKDLFPSK